LTFAAFTTVAIFSAWRTETPKQSPERPTNGEEDPNTTDSGDERTHRDRDAVIAEDEGGVGAGELSGRHGGGRAPLTGRICGLCDGKQESDVSTRCNGGGRVRGIGGGSGGAYQRERGGEEGGGAGGRGLLGFGNRRRGCNI